jgi:hypothetical protein
MDKRDQLIKAQRELIAQFDAWVLAIKANDLEKASEIVKQSNIKRLEIVNYEKTLKSKIITLN